METQTTFTFDPTNALSAMAFVVADQQQVIKRLREEYDVFQKEYKEALEIDNKQYKELDQQYSDLQKQYDNAIDGFNKQVMEINRDCEKQLEQVRAEYAKHIPVRRGCRDETDPNGNHYLTGFDHDGPVLLSVYVREGTDIFWDCFNCQRHTGEIAYMGVFVEHGIVENTHYAVDFGKEIMYLSLCDKVDYQGASDEESQS